MPTEDNQLSLNDAAYSGSKLASEDWSRLMVSVQSGDQEAYDKLLNCLIPILSRFLFSRVPESDRDDLLQTIVLSLHVSRHTYQADRPFLSWVFAIARFKLTDYYRKTEKLRKRTTVDLDDIDQSFLAYSDDHDSLFLKEHLQEALDALSDVQRDIIVKLKVEGYKVKEIAELKGLSVAAVKTNAHRGYKKIKSYLEIYYADL